MLTRGYVYFPICLRTFMTVSSFLSVQETSLFTSTPPLLLSHISLILTFPLIEEAIRARELQEQEETQQHCSCNWCLLYVEFNHLISGMHKFAVTYVANKISMFARMRGSFSIRKQEAGREGTLDSSSSTGASTSIQRRSNNRFLSSTRSHRCYIS